MRDHRLSLDDTDCAILALLQQDCSIANSDLAVRVGLSPSACLSRTKRLREAGFIQGYVAVVDETLVGFGIATFTFVTLARHDREAADSFLLRIREMPQVMECYHVTGRADYLLKILAEDIPSYREFLMGVLVAIPEVEQIETLVVLKTEKRSHQVPLGGAAESAKQ